MGADGASGRELGYESADRLAVGQIRFESDVADRRSGNGRCVDRACIRHVGVASNSTVRGDGIGWHERTGRVSDDGAVLKWFVRNRGKAVAFVGLGIPIGALLFIPLTQVLINEIGWRGAWIVLAIFAVCVIVPLSAIFVRRQPEDVGMIPDGDAPPEANPGNGSALRQASEEVSWTVREAVRTTTLWRLVIVFSMVQLATGTVALHRIAAFMDRGMDPTLISFATAFDAVAAGGSTFMFGMLVKWIPARFLGAVGFSMLAGASVLTIYAVNLPIMFVSMAIFGVGIGGMMFLNNYIWADYFGRANVGGIRGLANPINLVIGGIGAPAAGYVRGHHGFIRPCMVGRRRTNGRRGVF